MNRSFSIYLDLVRFMAACVVYAAHSIRTEIVDPPLYLAGQAHSAVVVFFVLSGFVIAYVADTKERDWLAYTASRASRVLSVAVPALLLTLVLDSVGRKLYPGLYQYPWDQFALRLGAALLMLNEVWFIAITPFSNVPYWSIAYEWWYYVAFGLATFVPGRRGWGLAALVLLLLGPKLILLAPIWASGVLVYRWQAPRRLSLAVSWLLAVGSLLAIVLMHMLNVFNACTLWFQGMVIPWLYRELAFSKFFIGDYLLCVLVVCNFIGMRNVAHQLDSALRCIERPVRWVAGFTFTLYLLHQPVVFFWAAVLRPWMGRWSSWLLVTALTAASIVLISALTEQRRHHLKSWLERTLAHLTGGRVAA